MSRKSRRTYRVLLSFSHNNKADRNRLSGALRFAALRPDWDVRILDAASSTFSSDCRRTLSNWPVDGFISSEPSHLRNLFPPDQAESIRTAVLDNRTEDGADISIRLNTRELVDSAIALLRRRGFDAIAFLGTSDPLERAWSADVETTFRKAMGRGIPPDRIFRIAARNPISDELVAVADWVSRLPKPCGIFAYSDDLARILLDACRLAKVNVPAQVAILGVDDSPDICETSRPTLSSILPDFEMSGFLAAKLLDGALRSSVRKSHRRTYGIKCITERESTQDQRGAGRIASAVLARIQKQALNADFRLGTLQRELNVSVRLLEIHFKKVMGHSIREEIPRRRLVALKGLLSSTELPVSTIVERCGFRTVSAAHAAFSKATGVSMTAWRHHPPA